MGIPNAVYQCRNQRFFACFFNIPDSNLPKSVIPQEGHDYYKYGGSNKLYAWMAFTDEETQNYVPNKSPLDPSTYSKTIDFVVGTDHAMKIVGFQYKAVSEY